MSEILKGLYWLDAFIAVVSAILIAMGIWRGFFRVVLGLVGAILGLSLAVAFSRPAGDSISALFDLENQVTGRIIAFITIYIGCWFSGTAAGHLIHKLLKTLKLGWFDRLLGGFLGGFKALLVTIVVLVIFNVVPSLKKQISDSHILPVVQSALTNGCSLLPEDWKIYLDPRRWIGEYPRSPFKKDPSKKKITSSSDATPHPI